MIAHNDISHGRAKISSDSAGLQVAGALLE